MICRTGQGAHKIPSPLLFKTTRLNMWALPIDTQPLTLHRVETKVLPVLRGGALILVQGQDPFRPCHYRGKDQTSGPQTNFKLINLWSFRQQIPITTKRRLPDPIVLTNSKFHRPIGSKLTDKMSFSEIVLNWSIHSDSNLQLVQKWPDRFLQANH